MVEHLQSKKQKETLVSFHNQQNKQSYRYFSITNLQYNIMTRKLILFSLSMMLTGALWAQQWQLNAGAESETLKLKRNDVSHLSIVGGNDNQIYLLRHDQKTDKDILVSYNNDLNELCRTELDNGKDVTYYKGFLNESSIDLLVSTQNGNRFDLYRERYDPKTLKPVGSRSELYSINHKDSKKMEKAFLSSASGEWVCALFVIPEQESAEARVNLYDTELEEMWNMDVTLDGINDIFVSDSGEVVFINYFTFPDEEKTTFNITILDGEKEQIYEYSKLVDSILRIDIVKYDNGKIYCTGLIKGERQDHTKNWARGYFSIVFDIPSKKIVHYEKQDFTQADICRLCNVPDRSKLKVLSTDKLTFGASAYDSEGALIVYERYYNLLINGLHTQTEFGGLLCLRIDNEGHIASHPIVRRQLVSTPDLIRNVYTTIFESRGTLFVATLDNPQNIDLAPEKPCKVADFSKSHTSLLFFTVSESGSIHRQYLERPVKGINLTAPFKLRDNEYLMFFSSSFKSCSARLVPGRAKGL